MRQMIVQENNHSDPPHKQIGFSAAAVILYSVLMDRFPKEHST
jgi:hypothetical protein